MRERVAHDILNAECAIDVEAAPTYENVNRRTVAVYAENGSDVVVDGKTVEYQCGVTSDLLPMQRIIEELKTEVDVNDSLIYTGTVPLLDGFKYGEQFSCKLVDEKLGREICLSYKVKVIEEH